MPYTYLEHGADVGIRSEGRRLEEAIEAGAEAMLGVMFDLDSVRERIAVTIRAQAPTPELLFV
ncbi:MAG TPA: archease, partial [Deltaproteobacteria bacterium]|nr:archease [Deltaproteobacteria bacterium]